MKSNERRLTIAVMWLCFGMVVLALSLVVSCTAHAQNPRAELAKAKTDAESLGASAIHVRYVSLYNFPVVEERVKVISAVSFMLNSVSRTSIIVQPPQVQTSLLRISLLDYGIPADVWEALVSDDEPYWHITTEVLDPRTKAKTKVRTDGGWVDLKEAAVVRTLTGSAAPIIRADWLVAKLCEPGHYYNLLGVGKTAADWEKLLGVERDKALALALANGTNLWKRGPTGKPGRIARVPTLTGADWATFDVKAANVGKSDPFRDPTGRFRYDASERFGTKLNGLWAVFLTDGQGNRIDAADVDVAVDDTGPPHDKELRAPISCFRCHGQKGVGGLIPFELEQAKLFAKNVKLYAGDPNEALQLAAFYGRTEKLIKQIGRDQEDADDAAKQASPDNTWAKAAVNAATVHDVYVYGLVDQATALREIPVEKPETLLGARDIILLALASENGTFKGVQRLQFESAFAEAAVLAAPTWEKKP